LKDTVNLENAGTPAIFLKATAAKGGSIICYIPEVELPAAAGSYNIEVKAFSPNGYTG
jgi:hypothetical protein